MRRNPLQERESLEDEEAEVVIRVEVTLPLVVTHIDLQAIIADTVQEVAILIRINLQLSRGHSNRPLSKIRWRMSRRAKFIQLRSIELKLWEGILQQPTLLVNQSFMSTRSHWEDLALLTKWLTRIGTGTDNKIGHMRHFTITICQKITTMRWATLVTLTRKFTMMATDSTSTTASMVTMNSLTTLSRLPVRPWKPL